MSDQRGLRAARSTHYGNLIGEEDVVSKRRATKTVYSSTPSAYKSKFAPVSYEVTNYGAKKFRTPYRKDQFTGTTGSRTKAVILDIDGTIQSWGYGLDTKIEKWLKKHYDAGNVFVVITARDEGMYESSFNWLMRHLPYPFIGPFTRADDDPRYASEFKRELAEDLSKTFEFVGAADDNEFVLKMWKRWAKDHFDKPEDFDIFEATYGAYSDWRKDLPSKGYNSYGTTGYAAPKTYPSTNNTHKDEVWVQAAKDPETGKWINGHWEKKDVAAKNRPAGTATNSNWGTDPADGKYKNRQDFIRSLADEPAWQAYFDKREKAGAYSGAELVKPSAEELLDQVIDESKDIIDAELVDDAPLKRMSSDEIRDLLEDVVAHNYPGYTPQELDDMTPMDLRELAEVTIDEVPLSQDERTNMEEDVYSEYPSMTYPEIEELDDDELISLYDAARFTRDGYGDEGRPVFDAHATAGQPTTEAQRARAKKVDDRLDIEDKVHAFYPHLNWAVIEGMDIKDLMEMLDKAVDEEAAVPQELDFDKEGPVTQPLDISEILTQIDEAVQDTVKANGSNVVPLQQSPRFSELESTQEQAVN